ncbi:hypothetical protein A2917_01915 [Candidatus Nomurabacteria bacterium RIFCSPLOWO2_01_FULL_42_17]|uniref:TrbC/VIRB2 family protein n=1 Tax=Candidatus Nomurabacteria bacterium RIFCSPLOWO2_01_FULL_42_17 TaxID=1801780 RepID=A0A1F6XL81_9BACT|nr:MAG: hypothetical protein A2917_01915 [Candidatus Nomurabacteria bacterium RIFCSPLOWO2_01_FULL_42_17]
MYNMSMSFIKKNLARSLFQLILMAFLVVAPIISFADNTNCDPATGKICNPIKTDSLNGLIKNLLEGVLKVGMPIVALAIIYCGFLFVSARGNTEKLTKAKDALLYTLIGAAILLGSWAIAQLISETVLSLQE